MKKYENRGHEMLSRAGSDPIGRFLLRLIGPGVRKELGRLEDAVSGAIGDVSNAFLDVEEGKRSRRRKEVVIDAEIVVEESKKK